MRGLVVVGASHGASEGAVAAAISAVARRAGENAATVRAVALGDRDAEALHAFDAVASPTVAARHAGRELDPTALATELRERGDDAVLVATLPGGLLAALTPRFTVRDLAADLRLPLVLAVPASPDALNLVRLSTAAARAARLTVVAVVLTGWPDPPDRVLLDEHRLLSATAGIPVLTLPAAPGARPDAVRDWPVTDWIAAATEPEPARAPEPAARPATHAPAAAAAPAAMAGPALELEPYTTWAERPVGDPRSAPRPRIMEAILEIVAAEGPMRASRAYAVYNRASGGKKLTTIARAPLSSSVYWLAQERKLHLTRRDEIPWQDDDVVRAPDAPAVRVRELGPRTLEEVPLDEIAELMRRLRDTRGVRGEAELKRAVLSTYGLIRLTTRADEYLGLAHGLMDGPSP
jgi:dethiobiotin synthetase